MPNWMMTQPDLTITQDQTLDETKEQSPVSTGQPDGLPTSIAGDERIVLNVGGVKYETFRSTLTAHPDTLLGTMFHPRNQALLHPTNGNEYFFDRNGYIFRYIMEYYRNGQVMWRPSMDPSILAGQSSGETLRNVCNSPTSPKIFPITSVTSGKVSPIPLPSSNAGLSTTPPSTTLTRKKSTSSQSSTSTTSKSSSSSTPSPTELEAEFQYFQIPFPHSRVDLAHQAAGALLDDFAYSLEDLVCCAIALLLDRISVTFYRDGSPMECVIPSKLALFSLNGYCIVNHFHEDLKRHLEGVFPNTTFKLDWGANYKSLTMSINSLVNRRTVQKYSRIGGGGGGEGGEIGDEAKHEHRNGNVNSYNNKSESRT